MEMSEVASLHSAAPSAMPPPAVSHYESKQHAHRLHGKQRNPRNQPEVTMKAVHDSVGGPSRAAAAAEGVRQQKHSSKDDSGSAQPSKASAHGLAHTRSMTATGEVRAPCLGSEAAGNLEALFLQRGAAELTLQGSAAATQNPASTAKKESMHNKRGLVEQAPGHVKHPRHRTDTHQGHIGWLPTSSQDTTKATEDAISAGHNASSRKQEDPEISRKSGRKAAQEKPELSGSQHVLPSTIVLDIWQTYNRADPRPLSALCTCSTCQRHSRAYIHHLLQTKEILAQVLSIFEMYPILCMSVLCLLLMLAPPLMLRFATF